MEKKMSYYEILNYLVMKDKNIINTKEKIFDLLNRYLINLWNDYFKKELHEEDYLAFCNQLLEEFMISEYYNIICRLREYINNPSNSDEYTYICIQCKNKIRTYLKDGEKPVKCYFCSKIKEIKTCVYRSNIMENGEFVCKISHDDGTPIFCQGTPDMPCYEDNIFDRSINRLLINEKIDL